MPAVHAGEARPLATAVIAWLCHMTDDALLVEETSARLGPWVGQRCAGDRKGRRQSRTQPNSKHTLLPHSLAAQV